MNDIEKYIRSLLLQQGIHTPAQFEAAFSAFTSDTENINNVKRIQELQVIMTKNWQVIARRHEINDLQVPLPNGISGKPYNAFFDFEQFGLADITSYGLIVPNDTGLAYDAEAKTLSGTPLQSGDVNLIFTYNFEGEPEGTDPNVKKITIIINPDPKSLWKDIPSDTADRFWKPDTVAEMAVLGGRKLVVASKRGRSHANKGSFRDDDYAYAETASGWNVIAISDGAGSASYSRKGAEVACQAVVNYFSNEFPTESITLLDEVLSGYSEKDTSSIKNKIEDIAYPQLLAAAKKAVTEIDLLAYTIEIPLNEFHATLAFTLFKSYPSGYAFFSFSVGDCPMALAAKNFEWVKPLNKLDAGDFGGGTRFITMPEIFKPEQLDARFNFEFVTDFPYLVLMTDGIYDPKFEVEANLAKPEKWKAFFAGLEGNNAENITVGLTENDVNRHERLDSWMDFWSPGNHDDRTLALLF
jgi:serine/threonine protein phosphatase PrpC